MKIISLLCSLALLASPLLAADASTKDEVNAAAKKLADSASYSWTATMDLGPNAPFKPGPTEGKTEKDGYTSLSVSFNENTSLGLAKGKKVAVKTDDGWKTAEEAIADGGGGFNPGTFMARRLQNMKLPSAEITELVSKAKEIRKEGDIYSGDLTEEGAKALLTGFGRQGGSPATEAKGSMKFWLKDGEITKYESKVSGKREMNGEVRDLERTITVEIKDVGKTKIEVPEDAKKKLS